MNQNSRQDIGAALVPGLAEYGKALFQQIAEAVGAEHGASKRIRHAAGEKLAGRWKGWG